ncbi:hypothetical protein RchiOBHm_Chr1g0350791 [Rosa chinensis]|uniref:Uncharacterized protein n=1 Tax=Rosa chinensis TaxID=74649 RepID=A0A2P6SG58_ROSCH|nr:hypothetical protein RchiOBHm_Chr1g0350791 [Rosa chinensis]
MSSSGMKLRKLRCLAWSGEDPLPTWDHRNTTKAIIPKRQSDTVYLRREFGSFALSNLLRIAVMVRLNIQCRL